MCNRERMDITTALEGIEEKARSVSAGDLSHAEALLVAQTVTLNSMFRRGRRRPVPAECWAYVTFPLRD